MDILQVVIEVNLFGQVSRVALSPEQAYRELAKIYGESPASVKLIDSPNPPYAGSNDPKIPREDEVMTLIMDRAKNYAEMISGVACLSGTIEELAKKLTPWELMADRNLSFRECEGEIHTYLTHMCVEGMIQMSESFDYQTNQTIYKIVLW
jgi:hypothetical protein